MPSEKPIELAQIIKRDSQDSAIENNIPDVVSKMFGRLPGVDDMKAEKEGFHNLDDEAELKRIKRRVYKNIFVVCLGYFCLFSGIGSLAVLQSSLNAEGGLGVISLTLNFGISILTSLFLPSMMINKLGCKITMIIAICCCLVWMTANLYATWATMLSASALLGLIWAPLWTSQCSYFTTLGVELAEATGVSTDDVMSKFFGIFFGFMLIGPLWGNVVSSAVLDDGNGDDNYTLSDAELAKCGAYFCPQEAAADANNTNLARPEQSKVFTLVGIQMGCAALGLLVIIFFMDRLPRPDGVRDWFDKQSALAALKQMKNKKQLLIIPLNIYIGLEQSFMNAEFTQSFVTCPLGIKYVGYVIICYALAGAVVSLIAGVMANLVGRGTIFIFAGIVHMTLLVMMCIWRPHPDEMFAFFLMPALWGVGDAIWQSQINAFYGSLFATNPDAAFANYRLWESTGFLIGYAYSSLICTGYKLLVLMGFLAIGMLCYIVEEKVLDNEAKALAEKQKVIEEEERDKKIHNQIVSTLSAIPPKSTETPESPELAVVYTRDIDVTC
ncbi:unnamed protein product [Owenia fusiformis]|uniref:Uncharacterized protein n=1 Tax=Owenia fusiformis TaxID=6347 RepID=A0A8J1Y206_OWEFU|nr:unnamed protein product [Owenia fusiformis]